MNVFSLIILVLFDLTSIFLKFIMKNQAVKSYDGINLTVNSKPIA